MADTDKPDNADPQEKTWLDRNLWRAVVVIVALYVAAVVIMAATAWDWAVPASFGTALGSGIGVILTFPLLYLMVHQLRQQETALKKQTEELELMRREYALQRGELAGSREAQEQMAAVLREQTNVLREQAEALKDQRERERRDRLRRQLRSVTVVAEELKAFGHELLAAANAGVFRSEPFPPTDGLTRWAGDLKTVLPAPLLAKAEAAVQRIESFRETHVSLRQRHYSNLPDDQVQRAFGRFRELATELYQEVSSLTGGLQSQAGQFAMRHKLTLGPE